MSDLEKPDLKSGVSLASIPDGGKLLGVVDEDEVLLVRRGAHFFAVGAYCTHYHGPLAEGLVVNDEVRCPWHHACFSLSTGEALRAPALDPIQCWRVEQVGEKVFVKEKAVPATHRQVSTTVQPSSILIDRRRCCRARGCGHASSRRIQRSIDDDQRRQRSPLRPSQSFEGFSGRNRTRRVDSPATTRVVFGTEYRPGPEFARYVTGYQAKEGHHRGWQDIRIWSTVTCHRSRSGRTLAGRRRPFANLISAFVRG